METAKTMKRTMILKRLEKSHVVNKNSVAYHMVSSMSNKKLIRPCYIQGNGRFSQNADHTEEILNVLRLLNINFYFGNDAPRGGKPGNYIEIRTKIIN